MADHRHPAPYETPQPVDLVLEGGGAKGVALYGAIQELWEQGYTFQRVAGTSSGAVTGAVVAALTQAGEGMDALSDVVETMDFTKILDLGPLASRLGPLAKLSIPYRVIRYGGMHPGLYMRDWLHGVLKDLGVESFGDLRRRNDREAENDITRRYEFVAVTTDLTQRRLSIFPWDAEDYGLEADALSVADIVHASSALPFAFQPVDMRTPHGTVSFADGGLLANYPIKVFANNQNHEPPWPTVGINLTPRSLDEDEPLKSVRKPGPQLMALIEVVLEGRETRMLADPDIGRNTILIHTHPYTTINFKLGEDDHRYLVDQGRKAARRWRHQDEATGSTLD